MLSARMPTPPIHPGPRTGPYELVSPLGAGGRAFLARDARDGRSVVVRILPDHLARDPRALARFEAEAEALATLGHPGLPPLLDRRFQDEPPFVVLERMAGETLLARIAQGPLAPRVAAELAVQLARGLAAAHEKGVIHRGLSPARLWIGKDGSLRILDFGWAPRTPPDLSRPAEDLACLSPEQARGDRVDARSDIFSFGAVFFWMLTGRSAFARPTAEGTLAAILQEEPGEPDAPLLPALRRILDHCLEKEPARRFRDAQDLAFALGNLSLGPSVLAAPLAPGNRRRTALAAAAGLLPVLGALGLVLGPRTAAAPVFHRLVFTAGTVDAARFGADGRTVYFSMRVAGNPPGIFVLDPRGSEPKPLGLDDARLLDVSPTDELALLQEPRPGGLGTLLRVPGGGGLPRVVRENVAEARWDGAGLATVASPETLGRLEFPEGRLAASWNPANREVGAIAVSRDHDLLACLDADAGRAATDVAIHDRMGGRKVLLTRAWEDGRSPMTGLAWGPGGDLWISEREGDQTVLRALTPGGRARVLWRSQGCLQLLDVAPGGTALLAQQNLRRGILAWGPGGGPSRELPLRARARLGGLDTEGRPAISDEPPGTGGKGTEAPARPGRVPGLLPGERVVGWSADGGSAYVGSAATRLPLTVTRVRLATAGRTLLASLSPGDPAGFVEAQEIVVSPGGQAVALAYRATLTELYRVEGLSK